MARRKKKLPARPKRKVAKKASARKSGPDWARPLFDGLSICIAGKTDSYWSSRERLEEWAEDEGATLQKNLSESVDMLVLLPKGALASVKKKVTQLNAAGASIRVLDEDGFLEQFQPSEDRAIEMLNAGRQGAQRLNELLDRASPGMVVHWSHSSKTLLDLTGISARKSQLDQCDFSQVRFTGGDLRQASIGGANLGHLENVQLDGATGENPEFQGLESCSFVKADIPRVECGRGYRDDKIIDCDFTQARMANADLEHMEIRNTNFTKADLTEAELKNSTTSDVNFHKACLRKADLTRAGLSKAELNGADLREAELLQTDLSEANLRGADLRDARLIGTKLDKAIVDGANFQGATLIGCSLAGVNVSKAKNLTLPPETPAKAGANCRSLNALAKKATSIEITASVDVPQGLVNIHASSNAEYRLTYRAVWRLTNDEGTIAALDIRPSSLSNGLVELGTTWAHGELQFDSIKVKSAKSSVKGKALSELATAALCEVFGVEQLSEEELKAKRKSAREKSASVKDDMLAELQGGKAGIEKWNKRPHGKLVKAGQFKFRKADLSKIKADGLKAKHIDLRNATLTKASLRKADLEDADLQGVNLSGADLRGAILESVNLREHLTGTSLSNANLNGAKMEFSSLRGTDFSEASFDRVKAQHCDFDEKTKFPDGFVIPESFDWEGSGHDPRIAQAPAPDLSGVTDFPAFMERLEATVDHSRLKKAMKMLKAESFELFSQVDADQFCGVVRSQRDPDLVYSCRLTKEGDFACCTQNLNACGGLRGALCKHLLVLIVGLTKTDQIDANSAAEWAHASTLRKPDLDKDVISETLLRYKGAEAGEVDWRPVETVPEDYYAF